MSCGQLWDAHYRNPNNLAVRVLIASRDPFNRNQLWLIAGPDVPMDRSERVWELEATVHSLKDDVKNADDAAEEAELKVSALDDQLGESKARIRQLEEFLITNGLEVPAE